MKKTISLFILIAIFIIVLLNNKVIQNFIVKKIIYRDTPVALEANEYKLKDTFFYVDETYDFYANSKEQLLKIVYTVLNNGWNSFTFYCNYDNCSNDINKLSNNDEHLVLNNFLHPYNSYTKIFLSVNSFGRVEISPIKTYNQEEISFINTKVDSIMKSIITDNISDREKIKAFHDYVINNTKYDVEYVESKLTDINNPSHTAIGPLLYGKALCGGYTDLMAIFLNKIGIPNYKISGEDHVWNLVYLDGKWLHLDLTWDDPVTSNGENMLLDKFFLITTDKLKALNTGYHDFNEEYFVEAVN